jgi:hypothetical protein
MSIEIDERHRANRRRRLRLCGGRLQRRRSHQRNRGCPWRRGSVVDGGPDAMAVSQRPFGATAAANQDHG